MNSFTNLFPELSLSKHLFAVVTRMKGEMEGRQEERWREDRRRDGRSEEIDSKRANLSIRKLLGFYG